MRFANQSVLGFMMAFFVGAVALAQSPQQYLEQTNDPLLEQKSTEQAPAEPATEKPLTTEAATTAPAAPVKPAKKAAAKKNTTPAPVDKPAPTEPAVTSPSTLSQAPAVEEVPVEKRSIRGKVLEKGTKIPLKDVTVNLLPTGLKTQTDNQGFFQFQEVPLTETKFVLVLPGYLRFEAEVELTTTNYERSWDLYVERESYSGFETRIVGQKQKRDDSRKTLKQSEFATLPGANGDPVKAVQNLPGVNRVAGFSSQVVIQGSAPGDTKYDLDGHEIPIVFHFGGLTSVVMPEAIERVDYLSAGYGSEYSRALGGVISLKTRLPEVQERPTKGFFFIDSLKSGGLIEGKIDDKSEYLLSARYSYIGFILRQVLKDNDQFNLTVAPEFADITGIYHRKLDSDEDLRVVTAASRDTLEFLFKEPVREEPSLRGTFYNETTFYRFIPQWSKQLDSDRKINLSSGLGEDRIQVDIGDRFFRLKNQVVTVRGELDQKINSNWKSQWGFDNNYTWANVDVKLPIFRNEGGVSNPISTSETRQVSINRKVNNIGLYWRNELTPTDSAWTYLPQLRFDYFNVTKESLFSPRFATRYNWDETLMIKSAVGTYVQAPTAQEIDSVFGNPDVKASHAIHAMLGFEKDLRGNQERGFTLNSSLFWKEFSRLVIQSSKYVERDGGIGPELYNNDGKGRAYGWEVMLKTDQQPWSGWISYTFSKSTRWNPGQDEYNFEYDQTHNVNIVTAYQFPRDWKLSSRFRYVTGNPETPIIGATFDADNDVYIPKRGVIYSERLKDFLQLDLRLDKKIIDRSAVWSVYLDIQNVLNTKNSEAVRYSYDYSVREEITGLPVLPSFGVKGEF